MSQPAPTPKEEAKGLLTSLAAGGDNTIKLAIIALILISGGTNFLATKHTADVNSADINQAIKEIHDLHEQLTASMDRQKEILQLLKQAPSK